MQSDEFNSDTKLTDYITGGNMAVDTNMKVLVVDDFATMRRIVKNILVQLGFKNIVEADDGTTAVDVLKSEKIEGYDIIFLT